MKSIRMKGEFAGQNFDVEIPTQIMRRHGNEKPHIHKSKPHPSSNDKICDLCGKSMVKHYHVCEDCWKFMKESLVTKIRELEEKVKLLEKRTE